MTISVGKAKRSLVRRTCGAILGLSAALAGPSAFAQSCNPGETSVAFGFLGASHQTAVVPPGVVSATIHLGGAQGGNGKGGQGTFGDSQYSAGGTGGLGAYVTGTLAVTPGEVLTVGVGGRGSLSMNPGGESGAFNGGIGGGATDLAIGGSLIAIAGGGGGGGNAGWTAEANTTVPGGNGGNSGAAGSSGANAGSGLGPYGGGGGALGVGGTHGGGCGTYANDGQASGKGGSTSNFSGSFIGAGSGGGGGGGAVVGGGGGGGGVGTTSCGQNENGGGGGGAGGSSSTGALQAAAVSEGSNSGDGFALICFAAPVTTLTSISPAGVPTTGGFPVTIAGTKLTGATAVAFGGTAALSFIVVDDTTITATTPPHAAGTVDVAVTTPDGIASFGYGVFTYETPPQLQITDVSLAEGNSGTTAFTFTVALDHSVLHDVTFDIATADGTALAGSDYVAKSLTGQTIPAGGSYSFTVDVTGDTDFEADETFFVNITNVSGATVTDGQATGTISNDDAPPVLEDDYYTMAQGGVLNADGGPGDPQPSLVANDPIPSGLLYDVRYDTTGTTGTINGSGNGVFSYTPPPGFFGVDSFSYSLDYTVAQGSSDIATATIRVEPTQPAVTGASPAFGPVAGNTTVTITGSNFLGATGVSFGGVPVVSFTVNSDTSITAVTPAGSEGPARVEVSKVNSGAQMSASGGGDVFTYQPPQLSIADVTQAEGKSGTTSFDFEVSLSAPAGPGGVSFDIATADGTALAGSDYVARSLNSQTISAGSNSYTFTVGVIGDTVFEATETFFVNVTNVTGATVTDGQATGTITNDDFTLLPPGTSGNVGVPLTYQVTVMGGVGPYTLALSSAPGNDLPPGLNLNGLTISGTPTAQGIYTVDLVVTDSSPGGSLQQTRPVSITIGPQPPPQIAEVSPDSGSTLGGTPVTITGGQFTGATAVSFGGLAATDVIVVDDATITATTPAHLAAGPVAVTVTNTSGPTTAQNAFTYEAPAPVLLTPISGSILNAGTVGSVYADNSVIATGGVGAITYSATDLPPGLSINPTSGVIEGTPTAGGTFDTVAVTATAATFGAATATYRIVVDPAVTTVTLASAPNPSRYQEDVTFTVTVSPAPIAGEASIYLGNGLGTHPVTLNGNGTGTLTRSDLPPGAVTDAYAHFAGTPNQTDATSATIYQTVDMTVTTLGLVVSGPNSAFGETVTFTATLSGAIAPTGSVQFVDIGNGNIPLGSVQLTGTQAILMLSTLGVGPHSVIASYTGDIGNLGSMAPAVDHTVAPIATALALTASAPSSTFGETVSFTATLSGATAPTGSVEFFDGTHSLGSAPLAGTQAVLQTAALDAGPHSITATYSGDTDNAGSTASPITHQVDPTGTTVTLSSSLNPSRPGDDVTFTVTVTPPPASGQTTMQLGNGLGTHPVTLDGNGNGTLTRNDLPPGETTDVVANFEGNPSQLAASSSTLLQAVGQLSTTVTLASSHNPSFSDEAVTFTVTPPPASGQTTIHLGNGLGTHPVTLNGNGVGTLTRDDLPPGETTDVVANFEGNASQAAASSAALLQTVEQIPTTVTLASSHNPSAYGEAVTFTITVSPPPAAGEAALNIGNGLGTHTVTLDGNGIGTLTRSDLPPGMVTDVIASFSGTIAQAPATSAALLQSVDRLQTALALAASAPSSTFGESVSFTATLSGADAPTGGILFLDGTRPLGSVPLTGMQATLAISTLGVGPHAITARYLGDEANGASAAPAIDHAVAPVVTALALTADPTHATSGQPIGVSVQVTPPPALPAWVALTGPDGLSRTLPLDASGAAMLTLPALPVGSHTIAASYAGSTDYSPSSATAEITIDAIATSMTLASDRNPANVGEAVTFTAKVTPATASGALVFSIDGADQPPVALADGTATFTTSLLAAGDHQVVVRYPGDATHAASSSGTLVQGVQALGSVTIRQETDGTDAIFGFSSPTPALNLSVATTGGHGQSAPVALPTGSYVLTGDDMTGAGFSLTGLACSDGDSTVDLAGRTAHIALSAGEALVCTFTSIDAGDRTAQLIEDFLATRADLILANQPDMQRRIDRLNGAAPAGGNLVGSLMGYVPGIIEGSPLSVSTSLGAIDRLAGNEQPNRFDAWFEGTFALFDADGPQGSFNLASFGADYLVTPDLLIGGFVQVDRLAQDSPLDPATISGTGWLAGPYATMRLSENLYLDLLAGAGTSSNTVSPYGTDTDTFDATRYLLSASLQGQWQWDDWTFQPRARLSYFEETTEAYTDSLGIDIPSITVGLGQVAIGPAISYRYTTEGNVVIDTGLRFEGLADILNTATASGFDNLHGRIEGTIDLSLPGGANIGLSAAYDGIGSNTNATTAKIRINVPID